MKKTSRKLLRIIATGSAGLTLLVGGLFFLTQAKAQKRTIRHLGGPVTVQQPGVYEPTQRKVETGNPVVFSELAAQEVSLPKSDRATPADYDVAPGKPHGLPERIHAMSPSIHAASLLWGMDAPLPSATGISAPAVQSFKGQFLSSTNIPPDTHGAVGTGFIVTVSNDFFRIQTRDGQELSRATINSFWSTATIKGVAVASAFDTKVFYDRFTDHFIMVASLNGPGINSGMGVAVTQTGDPTGTWFRYTVASDPTATASAGHAIDYPSVGINKNWITVDENVFNFTGAGFTTYYGQQVFLFDKAAAEAGTLSSVQLFEANNSTSCAAATDLGCGFTMVPALTEDNITDTMYMAEDWDNVNGQLRLSKITGTPSSAVLTVGTQFPQSPVSWQSNAARIGTTNGCGTTCSGGYAPQRQQSANLPSGTRIMTNDSRIQNVVLRNAKLWTTHTVMLAATPTPAGTGFSTVNPDTHSAVQWWQIDPSVEAPIDPITGLGTLPLQRARIEDATADNCHNGAGGTRATGTCTSTATQTGTFFAFPNISVNANEDVMIGLSQFSPLTYPSGAYVTHLHTDPVNTTRDPVLFRGGQANYNIGAFSGAARQNRWGDYSAAQTDPVDDTTFWTVQEYGGTVRDFGIGLAGNWETWWAKVNPTMTAPSTSGNLVISEFRLRGPQGARDEYVELYNPSASPLYVQTTDSSDGWALAYSANGTAFSNIFAVIPNGTVIPAFGHYLVVDNPDSANGPTVTYSLNSYPGASLRGADSDNGWSLDLADNGGIAIFKTAIPANMTAATRMDSAGFANIATGLFKEGAGIPTIAATAPVGQYTFYRDLIGGTPKDTGVNENDFIFVDPVSESFTLTPRLGAAGPKNLDSPVTRAVTQLRDFDTTQATGSAPNQVFDPTSVTNGANGTVLIRRTVVNTTGQPITRLRLRLVSTSTLNGPISGGLDLRLLSSGDSTAQTNDAAQCGGAPPCTLTIHGTTLETPPAQVLGGGWNSSASAATVTLTTPLAAGARLHMGFLFGVQSGTPLVEAPLVAVPVSLMAESLVPNPALAPTAATVSLSGRVLASGGSGVRGAVVSMTDLHGVQRSTITNAFGYYTFDSVQSGGSFVMRATARRFTFGARVINVSDSLTDIDFVDGQ
jgi:hypothetical protein